MSLVLDGNLGASMIQDGVVTEGKIVTGAVTDNKLTLTANSQEIKDALNATGSAPIYACRAWVNFNGTGTVAINASGNVSSITDNGTGDYTINFTTAMSDANYAAVYGSYGQGGLSSTNFGQKLATTRTTSALYVSNFVSGTATDENNLCVAIFR